MRRVLEPTVPIDVGALSQRQRIVDAMIDCCAEKTYAATTIADIVGRASISRTTFYKRFSGKRDCFDAAVDYCVDELRRVAIESHSSSDSPAETIHNAAAAALRLMAARPAQAQLVIGEAATVEPTTIGRYRKLMEPAIENVWNGSGPPRQPSSDPQLAFGRIQILLYSEILAGNVKGLPELLPEVVYMLLLPFAGHEEALRKAQLPVADAAPKTLARTGDG